MGMPRGLIKATHAASTIAAWKDWEKLACQAVNMGMEEHVLLKYTPFPKDRHQKIDKCIARLRVQIQKKREQLAWEAAHEERERSREQLARDFLL